MTIEIAMADLIKIAFGTQVILNAMFIMIIWLMRTDVSRAEKLVDELRNRVLDVESAQMRHDFYK